MKTTMSVLFTELSGSAGDVTASKWKGRPYVRTRVTPANPNTPDQQAQRAALKQCTEMWQSLVTKVKNSWDAYAAGLSISSFNGWSKANIHDQRATYMKHYTPAVGAIDGVTTVAGAAGSGSGEIDITWVLGAAAGTDIMHVAYRLHTEYAWHIATDAGTTASALTYTITGLTPATAYYVAVVNRDASDQFAAAAMVDATSHA